MPESNTNEFGHTFYPKYIYIEGKEPKIVASAKEEDEYRKSVEGSSTKKEEPKKVEDKMPPWDNGKK